MMPAAEAARRDVDPLDADVGPIFRLELDSVAVPLHVVVQVPGGESRRDETDPRRAESDARKRSEDCRSDDRCTQLLPETKYAHRFHLFPLFRSRVGQCPTRCNVRRKDSRKPWSSSGCLTRRPDAHLRWAQSSPRGLDGRRRGVVKPWLAALKAIWSPALTPLLNSIVGSE